MEEQMGQQNNPSAGGPEQSAGGSDKDVQDNKLWAFIGYLGILCLIPLLAKRDSKFAQFHAKQGLILLIAWFFVWILVIGWLLGIILFIFWIMAVINVFSGKMKKLPVIGDIAEKINI
ncbi:MAG TPA: hypothetical protein ENG89_00915 [Candidatus Moranbacteria bacterium]|nr:hypothetical protein [Candidatus Moranbacteria bacterium]